MKTIHSLIKTTIVHNKLLMLSGVLLLSACSSTSNVVTTIAPVNKPPQLTVVERCKATADEMALSAVNKQSQPQYLNAAKIYRSCSVKSLEHTSIENTSSTMKLYVLSTMNFIKGGDIKEAGKMVERFKRSFPEQDFYFANYTSFLDTTEALLGSGQTSAQLLATLNISSSLRKELLRKDYWLKN